MKREDVLKKAINLINGERANDYGNAYDNHNRIAQLWSVVLGIKVTAQTVALCLILVKVARLITSPNKLDSWIDIGGYTALGGEFVEKEKDIYKKEINKRDQN